MSCLLLCARVQYCICVRFSLLLSFIPNLMWSFSERLVYTVRLTWSTVSFHKQRHYQIVPLLLATSPSLLIHTHVLKMWLLILFTLCAVFFSGISSVALVFWPYLYQLHRIRGVWCMRVYWYPFSIYICHREACGIYCVSVICATHSYSLHIRGFVYFGRCENVCFDRTSSNPNEERLYE